MTAVAYDENSLSKDSTTCEFLAGRFGLPLKLFLFLLELDTKFNSASNGFTIDRDYRVKTSLILIPRIYLLFRDFLKCIWPPDLLIDLN